VLHEVCPRKITITDNAIIPLKERVVMSLRSVGQAAEIFRSKE